MNELKFTGERIVPQADNCEPNFAQRMYQEHIARYNFCSPLCVGKDVIDVGCGVGYGSQRLAALGAKSIFAFDLSPEAIAHAQKYYSHPVLEFSVENAEDFVVKNSVDVVVCFELIEHVNKPAQVLRRIRKALKPDGILIMSTPRALDKKRTHFHVHEFGYGEFEDLLVENFPNLKLYSENNHFVSIVGSDEVPIISQIEYIEGVPQVHKSDVFIAVGSPSIKLNIPILPKVAVVNSDSYVAMLERDVEILHKAEDDLKEKFEFFEKERIGQVAHYTRELEKTRELLSTSESLRLEAVAERDSQIDKLSLQVAERDGIIARLELTTRQQIEQIYRLTIEERAFGVRLADAEGRRSEAYDYARGVSVETNSWRSRYESLKRDLHQAIHKPFDGVQVVNSAERGHSDIIRAISEQFPGVSATHYLERDEILLGVDELRANLHSLQLKYRDLKCAHDTASTREGALQGMINDLVCRQGELQEALSKALDGNSEWEAMAGEFERRSLDLANRVRDTEHEIERVVVEIRNSTSWRITRPIRSLSIFVRHPVMTVRNLGRFASDNGMRRATGLVVRKLTGIGREG